MFMLMYFIRIHDFILIYAVQRQYDNIHNYCFACYLITSYYSYLPDVVMYYGISEVWMFYIAFNVSYN